MYILTISFRTVCSFFVFIESIKDYHNIKVFYGGHKKFGIKKVYPILQKKFKL